MKSSLSIIVISLFICSCSSKKEESTKSFISEVPIRSDSTDYFEKKKFDSLGGLTLIKLDTETKCNLTKGYYITNNTTDSTALAFLASYSARLLFRTSNSTPGCSYPVMASTFIYQTQKSFTDYEGNWISMCSITPSDYSGKTFVDMRKLKNEAK